MQLHGPRLCGRLCLPGAAVVNDSCLPVRNASKFASDNHTDLDSDWRKRFVIFHSARDGLPSSMRCVYRNEVGAIMRFTLLTTNSFCPLVLYRVATEGLQMVDAAHTIGLVSQNSHLGVLLTLMVTIWASVHVMARLLVLRVYRHSRDEDQYRLILADWTGLRRRVLSLNPQRPWRLPWLWRAWTSSLFEPVPVGSSTVLVSHECFVSAHEYHALFVGRQTGS